MAISVGPNGNMTDDWREQYDYLKLQIIEFCKQEHEDDPQAVATHLEVVEIDFDLDIQSGTIPGEDYDWRWRKDGVKSLIEQTEWLIEFGDPARFGSSIKKMVELKSLLRSLFKLIP